MSWQSTISYAVIANVAAFMAAVAVLLAVLLGQITLSTRAQGGGILKWPLDPHPSRLSHSN
jgi:hypothetical protein